MEVLTGRFIFSVIKKHFNKACFVLVIVYPDCKVVGMSEIFKDTLTTD